MDDFEIKIRTKEALFYWLEQHQTKLAELDTKFLLGQVPDATYKRKRKLMERKFNEVINKSKKQGLLP